MKLERLVAAAALAAGLTLSYGAHAATLVVGGLATGGNVFPFGFTSWAPDYQQVYGAADFPGAITIKDLVFFQELPFGSPNGGTYTIDLSETAKAVNGLDLSKLSNNIGANDRVVFSGSLPAISDDEMIIPLSAPYTYDPSRGNLLLDLSATNLSSGGASFQSRSGDAGSIFSRAISSNSSASANDGWGLVTGFTAVPEPATWGVLILGMGMIGCALRRRREATAVAA